MHSQENQEEIDHLNGLVTNHTKYLRVLENQAATFGLYVPPHIKTEIDDVSGKIQRLRQRIQDITDRSLDKQLKVSEISLPAIPRPINLGFEGAIVKGFPFGWFNSSGFVADVSTNYEVGFFLTDDQTGVYISYRNSQASGNEFGSLMQRCPAIHLAGRAIRFEGTLKSESVVVGSGLWIRADGYLDSDLFFDNMQKTPLRGTKPWRRYKIEAVLPKETAWLNYGIVLIGKGIIWVDDLNLQIWNGHEWQDV